MSDAQTSAQETPNAAPDSTQQVTPQASTETPVESGSKGEAAPAAPETPKAEAPAEQKPIVPEKYELKLPEGSHLPQSQLEKISSYAKEKGLSNEQAQELVNRDNELAATFAQQQMDAIKANAENWVNDIKNDKEFGGERFNETIELARRSVTHFGGPELQKALSETGLGNHPLLIKMHAKIGREMANDKTVMPNSHGSGSGESAADILYPTMKKK